MGKKPWSMFALDAISTLALVVAVLVFVWKFTRETTPAASTPRAARAPVASLNGQLEPSVLTNIQGSGRVAVVEFTDFECSFCGRYAREMFPAVKRELIDSGIVRYAVANVPLERIHPLAAKAAEAAECAGRQGKYWQMHDRLFAEGADLQPAALTAHAAAVALNPPKFAACMAGEATVKVHSDIAEALRLGVRGTPAFLIGTVREDGGIDLHTRIDGVADVAVLRQAVEALVRLKPTR